MQKKEVSISILTLIIITQVIMIFGIVYMAQNIVIMKQELNSAINETKKELENKIAISDIENQQQIFELSNTLITTKKDLTSQFNELKASTSSDFSGVIEDSIKGVVSISTDVAQGSGFIISNDGYIITNAHVLVGGSYALVLLYDATTWTQAKLIDYNTDADIAILKINGNFDPLEFGSSSEVKIGEKAVALGNPLGLSFSATEGIISGLKRIGINELPYYIQIDVPLNPGNSGGPLINKNGKVIGINNFKIQNTESIGFALESDYAVESINKMFKDKKINKNISF